MSGASSTEKKRPVGEATADCNGMRAEVPIYRLGLAYGRGMRVTIVPRYRTRRFRMSLFTKLMVTQVRSDDEPKNRWSKPTVNPATPDGFGEC